MPLRSPSLRACLLSLIGFPFVAVRNIRDSFSMTRACLVRRLRSYLRRPRPANSRFARSALHRFACVAMIVVMFAQGVLASPQVARASVEVVSATAINSWQGAYFWFHSSGLAKSLGIHLTSTTQGSRAGWDGRGAPKRNRPAQARAESNAEREARVARIKIYPGDVEINTGEPVVFAAVGFDSQGNTVGGLDVVWEALREDEGRNIAMRQSSFSSPVPGKFIVTADMAGRREQVRVTVKGNSLPPKVKSESEIKIDSRELRRRGQISRLAPAQGDEKRLVAGKNTTGKQLRASSKSMGRGPGTLLLPIDQDPTGWNEVTVATFSNVGNERGNAPGRAPSAGVGSGNFQITAPGVSLGGRGIDVNLPLYYNSRVWHKSGNTMYFDIDRDTLVAGWNLGFGKIVITGNQYMLVDGDGTRHEFSGIITPSGGGVWQFFTGRTTDGTFIDYSAQGPSPGYGSTDGRNIYNGSASFPDGTHVSYSAPGNYAVYPTQITDANGNYITITYRNNQGPNIETITDALGRVIRFHYDNGNLLTAITVPGLNGGPERQVVRLAYRDLTLTEAGSNYGFGGVSTVVRQNMIPVLLGIYYPATGNGYWFGYPDSYSRYGMIRKVSKRKGMTFSGGLNEQGSMSPGEQTRVQVYSNPSSPGYSDIFGSLSDTPTYTQMTEDWWARGNDVPSPITYFSVEDNGTTRKTTVRRPDDVRQEQITDTNLSSSSYSQMVENIVYPASGGAPLARSRTYFENGAYDSPRPSRSEAFDERGQRTETTFGYGSRFNAPTDMREYGYSGQLLRRVHTEYLNIDNYNGDPTTIGGWFGRHIFNLPSAIEVYAGDDSTRVSRVEYEYDGASLEDAPGVTQHYGTAATYPGNLTRVRRYADAASLDGGSAVVETFTYYITGNLRTQTTSCCEKTTFNYTANTQYAWPESMVRGSAGDPVAQNTTSAIYDFNTGLVMGTYDENGRYSNTTYYANSLRPEYGYSPTGAYVYHVYNDAGLYTNDIVYEAGRSGSDFASRADMQFDGRGQVIYEAAFGKDYVRDAVESVYDNLGRLWKRTRPFREEANPQKQWAVSEYDSMDRPVRVTSPDGSVTQSFYNESSYPSAATSSAGQTVRSRDAWGRERWARLDEQSRLVEVVEPNPSGDGSVASGGMSTQFYYDTLGNLTQVNQGAQTRRFQYDSLGRLTHQKLAERDAALNGNGQWVGSGQWSDVFFYDNRSNLTQRVDARGVKTIFKHKDAGGNEDPLNRLLAVEYDKSGSPAHLSANIPEAPNVLYSYMNTPGGDKMRVREVNASNGMWNRNVAYDIEGRVSQVSQTFAGRESYPLYTNYLWDTLGRIKEVRYPQRYGAGEARKVVTHNYDIASRLNELKYDGATMASGPVYNASDQITSLVVGGQITENYSFDPKTGLLLSQQVNKGAEQLLSLQYNYTLNNDPDNNGAKTGQLTGITDLKNTARNRAYEYDKLGRLIKVKGGVNAFANPTWYQSYSYDRYGNRTLVERTDLGMAPVMPGSQSRSDLIGKIGSGAGGAANRIFSADDPFAALGFNNDYGLITAGFSDSDSAGTRVRGGPRVTAEEYGNAPSANGAGGELPAKRHAGAQPAAPSVPQKKYGARRGLSVVTAQSISSVNPTAYQTPDPGWGGLAVNSPSNTGHGATIAEASSSGGEVAQTKTSMWRSFQGVSGVVTAITLKFEYLMAGYASAGASYDPETGAAGFASGFSSFDIEYSLNGGASWNSVVYLEAWAPACCQNIDSSDSFASPNFPSVTPVSVAIPPSTPISQIRVRSRLHAYADAQGEGLAYAYGKTGDSNPTSRVQNIRLEVETETTPPVISNVAAGSVTATGATINWATNENSDSQVEYGTTQAYGQSTTLNPALVTAHLESLSGLTAGTGYHYRVKSRDTAGNLAVSGDFTFTTEPPPDTTAPVISNVAAGGITTTSATITWATNENSDSQVEYGTTTAYGQSTALNPALVTARSQALSGLAVGTLYHYRVKSRDAAGNLAISGDFTFTTASPPVTNYSIWSPGATPGNPLANDPNAVELGLKFRSDVNGFITGVRFYKGGATNGGTHVGHLWTGDGTLLGSVTFTNETESGWQQAIFQNPIPITANTTYVVSYFAPQGNYAADNGYFASSGVDNGPLHALSSAVAGGNGVFRYGPTSGFPTDTFQSSNYWVDVVFNDAASSPPRVISATPATDATFVSTGVAPTARFSKALDPASVNASTVLLRDAGNGPISVNVSYSPGDFSITLAPQQALQPGQTYTVTLKGGPAAPHITDSTGTPLPADYTWSFTTATGTAFSIWAPATTPANPLENDGDAVEVGLKFRSDSDGFIAGVRFYKGGAANGGTHVGHLWTGDGTLLGSAPFTNESESGWQHATFQNPIPITANTTYVVSYFAPQGHYAGDNNYFASSGVDNGPLHALSDAVAGGNGVYRYSPTSGFPTDTFQSSNYWVDVVFTTAPSGPDTTPPTVTSFSPAAGANVSREANVIVTFSEVMNAATVNGATVELRDPSNALVSATVSYDAASLTATLDPTVPLSPGVAYTARVKGGGADPRVKDAAGNALAADLTWSFTTAQGGAIPLDGLANLAYNTANNRITTQFFEYDPAGNQIRAVINASGTQQQYRYDCAGRLAQVLDANGTPLATYSYVEGNERLMSVEGGVTTYYARAGGQIIAEYEASGANALVWKMSYVYMGGKLLATEQAEGIRYHHPDQLGTPLVTDASDGAVISEQLTMPFGTQLPYGSTLGGDNSWQHPGRSNLSKKKFTSYDRSDATGLDYAVNRFYSPQQGRFTQVDPIGMGAASLGDPQSLNLYNYCGNDPINNVDSDGLFWGAIGNFFKAIGKAIATFFSPGSLGYPGFRTPPTFPGSTPSTISVSSGGNVNFRTPPLVNGLQQAKVVGWGTNSNNDLVDELGRRIAFEIEPMTIRAFGSPAEELAFEMSIRANGMEGLAWGFIIGGWAGGLAVPGAGTSLLLLNSAGMAALEIKQFHEFNEGDIHDPAVAATIESDRRWAVKEAWKQEAELVRRTGRGTRPWTQAETRELLRNGKVSGYEGHHINSVQSHPHWARNPNNIEFVRGRAEHLLKHRGDFRNPTRGRLLRR
jgi:RHS repeat-associated protein